MPRTKLLREFPSDSVQVKQVYRSILLVQQSKFRPDTLAATPSFETARIVASGSRGSRPLSSGRSRHVVACEGVSLRLGLIVAIPARTLRNDPHTSGGSCLGHSAMASSPAHVSTDASG